MKEHWLIKQGFEITGTLGWQAHDWQSWKWQFARRIKGPDALSRHLDLTDGQKQAIGIDFGLPFAITPYYAALIAGKYIKNTHEQARNALIRMAVPSMNENASAGNEFADPLAEEAYSPVPGLVHRYPDRILLSVASVCPVYCRYCTRRRYVGRPRPVDREAWWEYIAARAEIREVIVSGGEPMTMGDDALARILGRIRANDHIQVIRLSTRTPAVLPCRITDATAKMLAEFQPMFVLTQFNHPAECTVEAYRAIERLRMAGVPVLNQMVLLRGVNDQPEIIAELGRKLLVMGIKPYYIHQMDAVEGTAHFRVGLGRGLEIMRELRRKTSGIAVPKYVIDLPEGGGKVSLAPNYVVEYTDTGAWLAGTDGRLHRYEWEKEER